MGIRLLEFKQRDALEAICNAEKDMVMGDEVLYSWLE